MQGKTILYGMISGAAGTAIMTLGEKVEQAITGRPNSHVPARTLERLLGLSRRRGFKLWVLNHTMHWGQGILAGAVRAWMAERGIRGPFASFVFTGLRLAVDQTLENALKVGTPPWTWPAKEQLIDILHKGVYATATGLVADALLERPPRGAWRYLLRPSMWRQSPSML
jgi:hypothetical protein